MQNNMTVVAASYGNKLFYTEDNNGNYTLALYKVLGWIIVFGILMHVAAMFAIVLGLVLMWLDYNRKPNEIKQCVAE